MYSATSVLCVILERSEESRLPEACTSTSRYAKSQRVRLFIFLCVIPSEVCGAEGPRLPSARHWHLPDPTRLSPFPHGKGLGVRLPQVSPKFSASSVFCVIPTGVCGVEGPRLPAPCTSTSRYAKSQRVRSSPRPSNRLKIDRLCHARPILIIKPQSPVTQVDHNRLQNSRQDHDRERAANNHNRQRLLSLRANPRR
jgi:hypothetical protein